MPPIRTLNISGTHYEMGYHHGFAHKEQIRELTEERIHLCSDMTWTGRTLSRDQVMELAEACIPYHRDYAPDLMEELEGMAAATRLHPAELLITSGFTDFVDTIYNSGDPANLPAQYGNECTTMLIANEATVDERGFLAQTWDMHATATPYVILMRGKPVNKPAFTTFTVTGCMGMIGMNDAGIAIGINNLVGIDGRPGVTWPFVIRKVLEQTNLDDALDCIVSAHLAGGHNYQIMDRTGAGYNVEAMASRVSVTALDDTCLTHANICTSSTTRAVERPMTEDLIDDSLVRQQRASQLIRTQTITPECIMDITRDRSDGSYSICALSEAPFYSETCGAVIMRPASGEFWAVWGLPIENEYEHFVVSTQKQVRSYTPAIAISAL